MKKVLFAGILSVALALYAAPDALATKHTNPPLPAFNQTYGPSSVQGGLIQQMGGSQGGSSGAGTQTLGGSGCSNLTTGGLQGLVGCIITFFNLAVYLMMAAAVVYVVYGAFIMISNEEKREEGKKTIYYGIIGLFVMISIWGFVNILDSTFNLRGTVIAPPPLTR